MVTSLSLCTIVLNEQDLIGPMLDSVAGVVGEIVIGIDNRTLDATDSIATQHGARTFRFTWTDDFAEARNGVIDHATGDWILHLDADERLTQFGAMVIRDILSPKAKTSTQFDGFCFLLANTDLQGKTMAVQPTSNRLFRRHDQLRYRGVVHEEVCFPGAVAPRLCMVNGQVAITHVGYDPTIWVSRNKHERNLRLLQRRVLSDPTDEYAQRKLAEELALDKYGMTL